MAWGFPCGGEVATPWLRHICRFFDKTRHGTTMPLIANQSGVLDLARSYIIRTYVENGTYDWLIQVEPSKWVSDAPDPGNPGRPFADLDMVVAYLEEDRALGFDAVAAPTISPDGLPNFGLTPQVWATVNDHDPFPALWSGCAFFAMSRKALLKLQVLDWAKSSVQREDAKKPGEPEDRGQAMYCKMNLPKEGEDVSLCMNIRNSGLHLAIDPRIPVGPAKSFPMYIGKESWEIWRKGAADALEARAKRLAE